MIVPAFKDPDVTKFLTNYQREMDQKLKTFVANNKAGKSVLLFAPDLSVWEVTVSNAGVLTTTKIAG